MLAHLTEMRLARQSRQMAEKDQQNILVETIGEVCSVAVKIQERQ